MFLDKYKADFILIRRFNFIYFRKFSKSKHSLAQVQLFNKTFLTNWSAILNTILYSKDLTCL